MSEDGVEAPGGSGVAEARTGAPSAQTRWRQFRGEATQMIKGTERLISEGRLKGLNIYIAWLRAVRGETN